MNAWRSRMQSFVQMPAWALFTAFRKDHRMGGDCIPAYSHCSWTVCVCHKEEILLHGSLSRRMSKERMTPTVTNALEKKYSFRCFKSCSTREILFTVKILVKYKIEHFFMGCCFWRQHIFKILGSDMWKVGLLWPKRYLWWEIPTPQTS